MRNWLRRQFTRKEWTANPADPTVVVRWSSRYLVLVGVWAVEAHIHIGKRAYRFYNWKPFTWLWGWLEDRWVEEQQQFADDPMGYGGQYR